MPAHYFMTHPWSSDSVYVYKAAHHFDRPFTVGELRDRIVSRGFEARHGTKLGVTVCHLANAKKFIRVSRGVYRVAGLAKQLSA
jgi:hypothetical protein